MTRLFYAIAVFILPMSALAQHNGELTRIIIDTHVLPRFEALEVQTQHLADAATADCSAHAPSLRDAYAQAFDAWVGVSHLRFGPSEVDDRAFALAFWPDTRGKTPKTLAQLIADEDPVAQNLADFSEVSIAARGFYALEFMLFDDRILGSGHEGYRCQLVQTMTRDIATLAAAIHADWQLDFAERMTNPTPDGPYQTHEEALQQFFGALSTGLEFTGDTRLGRPLGTFDRPRPLRAEAWRSGRSAYHVAVSLVALEDLALELAGDDPRLTTRFEAAFENAQTRLRDLNDPVFAGVAAPQSRLKIEVVQQAIGIIRAIVRDELGPTLGVAAGFNALDGD